MADIKNKPAASQPPPEVTYTNPRRTAPENSVTLRHHRIGREASRRNSPLTVPQVTLANSPRRNSTDESNETAISDPRRWFDRSNEHPIVAGLDSSMDIDPPFFQRETDSSNDETRRLVPSQSPAYKFVQHRNHGSLRPGQAQSSSADDFRSVIDDLTIENKRLKEELKKYKQIVPDSLRGEKLLEVKVHGLASRKKRELEAALRDFTNSLDGSSTGVSAARRKDKGKGVKHFGSSMSKHASSSSGSQSRPVPADSAYASMSTGAGSTNQSLPGKVAHQRSDLAVERYLQDVPQGLWPKSNMLAEREKKKLVVRRLEQLFTGKGLSRNDDGQSLFPVAPLATNEEDDVEMVPPHDQIPPLTETNREAQILPQSQRHQGRSRGNGSVSNSRGDRTEPRDAGNDNGSGSGHKSSDSSPPGALAESDQRPTRPRDLDPDRIQVPSENMDYIRHLGLVAPESRKQYSAKDVSPEAEGWVYLNLLCNLAQLHMYNVTPDFIRSAVSEKSKQFQLSPDGRKIRWRGGAEGTKFSSDSSGSNSQRENISKDTDESNDGVRRKKQKTQAPGNNATISEPSKFVAQISSSSGSFHYKPLFVHHQSSSSEEQPSLGEESGSSCDPPEESNLGMKSKWNQSGVSRVSQRKRRRDGAIIYYTGAPFCTDLSGDFGELSPDSTKMTSSKESTLAIRRRGFSRTMSGSLIPFKPLSSYVPPHAMMDLESSPPELRADDSDDSEDIDAHFPWSNSAQSPPHLAKLEASGLGGITPDDHFVVTVSTLRPKSTVVDGPRPLKLVQRASQDTAESRETTESVVRQLATMTTDSPVPSQPAARRAFHQVVAIDYVSGKVRRLPPAPLPPPTFFVGTSDSTSSSGGSEYQSEEDVAIRPRHLLPARQGLSESNDELSSNDEEDEHLDDAAANNDSGSTSPDKMGRWAPNVPALSVRRHRGRRESDVSKLTTPSSVATAGGAESGYISTEEE